MTDTSGLTTRTDTPIVEATETDPIVPVFQDSTGDTMNVRESLFHEHYEGFGWFIGTPAAPAPPAEAIRTPRFEPGARITGPSVLDESVTVTGIYLRKFGTSDKNLLVQRSDGRRDVIAADTAQRAKVTAAGKLRAVAAHLDAHPEISHLSTIKVTSGLDLQLYVPMGESAVAALLPWARSIGAVNVSASRTADWHVTARGRTESGEPVSVVALTRDVETTALDLAIGGSKLNGAIRLDVLARHQQPEPGLTEEQLAEVKNFAENPLPRTPSAELHVMRATCWCLPASGECGALIHRNEDGSEPQFAATDADPITRDGYATEDHR